MPETAPDGAPIYRPVLGGSLFNVAMGIARLGGTAGFVWELSTDAFGRQLVGALMDAGVDVSRVARTARMTPVAVVDMSGEEPVYNIADGDEVMRRMAFQALPQGTGILHIGSAVLAREPIASAIESLADRAPLVSIDFNVRPPSIGNLNEYRDRLMRISGKAALVKASVADLDILEIRDRVGFCRDVLASGAGLVVLTMGADGALAQSASGAIGEMPTKVAQLIDPVGAGDAFMAGLLTYLQSRNGLAREALSALSQDKLNAALAAAQRAAAAVCASQGALMPAGVDIHAAH